MTTQVILMHLASVTEFAQIVRGEHGGYRGDRRYNGGHYLYCKRRETAEIADAMAKEIEDHVADYMEQTGLPERTLLQACKVLKGEWTGI